MYDTNTGAKSLRILSEVFFYLLFIVILMFLMVGVESSLSMLPSLKGKGNVVAAFVEETFKTLALIWSAGFATAFTVIFASLEMINYCIVVVRKANELPIDYMIFRMICISVHLITLLVQVYFFQLYQKKKDGTYWLIGYLLAIFIHLLWNQGLGALFLRATMFFYKSAVMLLG